MTKTKELIEQVKVTIKNRVEEFDQAAVEYLEIKENDDSVLYTNHMGVMRSLSDDIDKLMKILLNLKGSAEALEEDESVKLENYDGEQYTTIVMAESDYKEILEKCSFEEEL